MKLKMSFFYRQSWKRERGPVYRGKLHVQAMENWNDFNCFRRRKLFITVFHWKKYLMNKSKKKNFWCLSLLFENSFINWIIKKVIDRQRTFFALPPSDDCIHYLWLIEKFLKLIRKLQIVLKALNYLKYSMIA